MKFNSHGNFDIALDGNILKITANFAWNQECANEFVINVQHVIENRAQAGSFVTLCIVEEDWLPTSDSLSTLTTITKWGVDKGMKKEAFLFKTKIAETLLLEKLLAPLDKTGCEFKSFDNEDEALYWLAPPR